MPCEWRENDEALRDDIISTWGAGFWCPQQVLPESITGAHGANGLRGTKRAQQQAHAAHDALNEPLHNGHQISSKTLKASHRRIVAISLDESRHSARVSHGPSELRPNSATAAYPDAPAAGSVQKSSRPECRLPPEHLPCPSADNPASHPDRCVSRTGARESLSPDRMSRYKSRPCCASSVTRTLQGPAFDCTGDSITNPGNE